MVKNILFIVSCPFYYIRSRLAFVLFFLPLVTLLTLLTQVGGIVLWLMWSFLAYIHRRISQCAGNSIGILSAVFCYVIVYSLLTGLVIPHLAPLAGRVAMPCFANEARPLAPANVLFCAMNRNYVQPELKSLISDLALYMSKKYPGHETHYLDAGFPFIKGFPLLPHLGHNDGLKIDLAFSYRNAITKEPVLETASPIGYWAFEKPWKNEKDACPGGGGLFRWHFPWLQPAFPQVQLDPDRTREMLEWLTTGFGSSQVRLVFIEPHLKDRLGLFSSKIRFQGCRAARHDDHIHVELL